MSVLKGSPEHLRQTSLRFREASRHSQEILKQIVSMVQSLQAEWQGQAYQRFCQDFQQVHSRIYQSAGALEQLGRLLDQAAAKLMEAEQRAGGSVAAFGGGMSSGPLASREGAPVIEIVSDGDLTSATFVGGSGAGETTLVVSAEIIDMGGKHDEVAGYFSEPNASGAFPGATVAAHGHSGPLLGAHDETAHDQNLNAPVAHSSASSDLHSNIQIVAEVARQKGLDPVMAVATMLVESGGDNRAVGDGGTSFGLFQLHRGGELGDMKPEQAFVPRTNAETSLSEFARIKDRHSDPGELAAAAQRPADPEEYARKVDAMLPEARKLLGL